jgi:hypothetical protein
MPFDYTYTNLVTFGALKGDVVFSTYVKASAWNFVYLKLDGKNNYGWCRSLMAIYDLSGTGTARIFAEDPENIAYAAGIESLADGWYRIWVTGYFNSRWQGDDICTWIPDSQTPRISVATSLTNPNKPYPFPEGAVWFWFWGPQIEVWWSPRPSSLFDWAHHTLYPTRDRQADRLAFYSTTNCWDGYNNIRADIVSRQNSNMEGPAVALTDTTPPGGYASVYVGGQGHASIADGPYPIYLYPTLNGTSTILNGKHSVSIEYDEGGADLIVDDVVEDSGTPNIPATPGNGYIYIGCDKFETPGRPGAFQHPFALISKIKIWSRK